MLPMDCRCVCVSIGLALVGKTSVASWADKRDSVSSNPPWFPQWVTRTWAHSGNGLAFGRLLIAHHESAFAHSAAIWSPRILPLIDMPIKCVAKRVSVLCLCTSVVINQALINWPVKCVNQGILPLLRRPPRKYPRRYVRKYFPASIQAHTAKKKHAKITFIRLPSILKCITILR